MLRQAACRHGHFVTWGGLNGAFGAGSERARTIEHDVLPRTGWSPEDFRRIVLGEPRERTKAFALTQLADLVLYPVTKAVTNPATGPTAT